MKVETTATAEISETDDPAARRSWRESEFFKTLEAVRPYVSWLLIATSTLVILYIGFVQTNAEQGTTIKDLDKRLTGVERSIPERSAARDRQIQDLKTSMVTNELFNERTDNIFDQLKEIKADQKEILNRLPVRLP
jgi:hypothetical protein